MSNHRAVDLRHKLIRNFLEVPRERFHREPAYDSMVGGVTEGTLRVAGELLTIRAGDVICIPCGPEFPHHIINTSDAELKYLSISTQDRPEVCEYPDSGKIAVFSKGPAFIQRRDNSLDYWDGEG